MLHEQTKRISRPRKLKLFMSSRSISRKLEARDGGTETGTKESNSILSRRVRRVYFCQIDVFKLIRFLQFLCSSQYINAEDQNRRKTFLRIQIDDESHSELRISKNFSNISRLLSKINFHNYLISISI